MKQESQMLTLDIKQKQANSDQGCGTQNSTYARHKQNLDNGCVRNWYLDRTYCIRCSTY